MAFHEQLLRETTAERNYLFAAPILADVYARRFDHATYIAFLTQAYHHVVHTVPLMMACGARLPNRLEWLRVALRDYIVEETGHHEWILADIAACGGDADTVRNSLPAAGTELMVAYVYDYIARNNPVGFFGMVQVLEGTSVALASGVAALIKNVLGLPDHALTYLTTHGALDVEHVDFYANLVNRLDDEADRAAVIHVAKRVYHLYGDMIRGIPNAARDTAPAPISAAQIPAVNPSVNMAACAVRSHL